MRAGGKKVLPVRMIENLKIIPVGLLEQYCLQVNKRTTTKYFEIINKNSCGPGFLR